MKDVIPSQTFYLIRMKVNLQRWRTSKDVEEDPRSMALIPIDGTRLPRLIPNHPRSLEDSLKSLSIKKTHSKWHSHNMIPI